ncbi:MAG: hypothetical protein PUA62_02715 [Lachnospiraceae bacterium]|nr:hypothetical protein [Lachnospiraceae bacterium]
MKIINKIKRKLNNQGSSIIMVIVALSFIGIIVGSLLSAAGSAYNLKKQELNAKDNFYYVEQAMQEIYTGVGMQTIEEMKTAYAYTVENMVRYDTDLQTYKTLSNTEANKMFKDKFMEQIMNSEYFKRGAAELATTLQGYISNSTVTLDASKLSIVRQADRIVLKDVTVSREQEYKSKAGGTYTQTVCADIVISQPNFEVQFNTTDADYSALFDFAMVADMGVEIKQAEGVPLVINGNIYAASDYYNKSYNSGIAENTADKIENKDGTTVTGLSYSDGVITGSYTVGEDPYKFEYAFSKVSNKQLEDKDGNPVRSASLGYVNDYYANPSSTTIELAPFNGENLHSRYSGLYIDGSNVSIMTDTVIVPGSLAVMNNSDLVVYGRTGSTLPQIWADDVVLGGMSKYDDKNSTEDKKVFTGSQAIIRANLFVKDDMQLDADGTSFTLSGSYYGYGDGTSRDSRVFFDTVDPTKFQITVKDGENEQTFNRGHFNSSAIVVNGQNATLDFGLANNIYVAGRAYVELSRYGTEMVSDDKIKTTTYTYLPYTDDNKTDFIRDYKTGESIAYKPSQLLYTVSTWEESESDSTRGYDAVDIPLSLQGEGCFMSVLFPEEIFHGHLPVIKTEIKERDYVFIDFVKAWEVLEAIEDSTTATTEQKAKVVDIKKLCDSADAYQSYFAYKYVEEAQKEDASPALVDISKYDEFENGMISYTTSENGQMIDPNIYSSGAITVNKGNTFTMSTPNSDKAISALLSGDDEGYPYTNNMTDTTDAPENLIAAAYNFSNDLEMEYNYVKWNLAHYKNGDMEKQYIKDVIGAYGEGAITPLNKYLLIQNFDEVPSTGYSIDGKELSDGNITYRIWASDKDIVIDDAADLTGIIVTKGDVSFGDNVTRFTGIIISGGKVYVGKNMREINAAPATCREIMRQCMRIYDTDCKYFLKLFREYASVVKDDEGEGGGTVSEITPMVNVNSIGFSDVVSMENWTKNVGGAYEVTE